MFANSTEIPFALFGLYEGWAKARGIATVDSSYVTLEFEVKDILIGIIRSKTKEICLPLKEIESIQLINRWWQGHPRIEIKAKSLKAFSKVPDHRGKQITLYVSAKDIASAEKWVMTAQSLVFDTQMLLTKAHLRILENSD
ncbi:MAG TPA: hypothetical protein V6C57_09385 [Coleofasciculaceae cyanobacterium]